MAKKNFYNLTAYLAGPIENSEDGGASWRDELTTWLWDNLMMYSINPLNNNIDWKLNEDKETREDIKHLKETGQFDLIREKYCIFRQSDLSLVKSSDVFILFIDADVHMCGSYEELTVAVQEEKFVVIVCKQGRKRLPSWIFFMMPTKFLFDSFDDMKKFLLKVDSEKLPITSFL